MRSAKEISEEMHAIAVEHCQTRQKPYISILQPRRSFKETPAQQLQSWKNRMIDMTSVAVSFHGIDGNPVDSARCYLMEKAIEDDAKYALFVDEDTALPYFGVRNLIKTSEKYPDAIISGIYYVKFGNVMMSVLDEAERWVLPDVTPNSGLIRNVVSTGLGCALIPLTVIKKLKEKFEGIPLFCIVPENTWGDDKVTFMGEDTWFYALCKKAGIEVIGDTSVQCVHMELKTGKYEAHPDVCLDDYLTNIPLTIPLTMTDRPRVSKDYNDRICIIPIMSMEGKTLEEIYNEKYVAPHAVDINEHMPTLKKYAEECQHITEFGVQYANSTIAFMSGFPKRLISYDIVPIEQYGLDRQYMKQLALSNNVDFDFIVGDTREIEIEETDILFIDTEHTYDQLIIELTKHGNKSRKYIILHDTTSKGIHGDHGKDGLLKAINEFLGENKEWQILETFTNNNGLTILKRNDAN